MRTMKHDIVCNVVLARDGRKDCARLLSVKTWIQCTMSNAGTRHHQNCRRQHKLKGRQQQVRTHSLYSMTHHYDSSL